MPIRARNMNVNMALWHRLAAAVASVWPGAAVATDVVYHHQYQYGVDAKWFLCGHLGHLENS